MTVTGGCQRGKGGGTDGLTVSLVGEPLEVQAGDDEGALKDDKKR